MAVCECLCARVQGVGGWVSESMTWHFLHPVSAPDNGLNAQPRLAILYYSTTHTHTHTHTEHKRGGSARERSCVTVR